MGKHFSTHFSVSNDVTNGGIISPVLLNVYVEDLICAVIWGIETANDPGGGGGAPTMILRTIGSIFTISFYYY